MSTIATSNSNNESRKNRLNFTILIQLTLTWSFPIHKSLQRRTCSANDHLSGFFKVGKEMWLKPCQLIRNSSSSKCRSWSSNIFVPFSSHHALIKLAVYLVSVPMNSIAISTRSRFVRRLRNLQSNKNSMHSWNPSKAKKENSMSVARLGDPLSVWSGVRPDSTNWSLMV